MKKSISLSLSFFTILFFNGTISAVGLGITFPYGFGEGKYEQNKVEDASQIGINFVFDTNVAKKSKLSYRLNLGIEYFNHNYKYKSESWDPYGNYSVTYYHGSQNGLRLVSDHTFCIGIYRSPIVGLWFGPNARLGYFSGDDSAITWGFGLTFLGLNVNLGRIFTLSLETGYLYNTESYFDDGLHIEYSDDPVGRFYDEYSQTGITKMYVAKISILFRMNDVY